MANIRSSKPDHISDVDVSLSSFRGATSLCKELKDGSCTSYMDSPSSQGMRREYNAFGSSTFSISWAGGELTSRNKNEGNVRLARLRIDCLHYGAEIGLEYLRRVPSGKYQGVSNQPKRTTTNLIWTHGVRLPYIMCRA